MRPPTVCAVKFCATQSAICRPLELPPFEDANSIQIALMQVVDAILHNRIDTKRAGLVLYALQTASSNLANGADFQQDASATVAGRYDDFEDDFELGDDVPELSTDAAEEAQADEEYATAKQMELILETCHQFEEAKKEAAERAQIETEEDGAEVFHCDPVDRLLCGVMGPTARGGSSGGPQRYERDAASQWLELSPSPAYGPLEGGESSAEETDEVAA